MVLPLNAKSTLKEASQWTAMMQFGGYIIGGIIPMLVGAVKGVTNTYNIALLIILVLVILLTLKVRTKIEYNLHFNKTRKLNK